MTYFDASEDIFNHQVTDCTDCCWTLTEGHKPTGESRVITAKFCKRGPYLAEYNTSLTAAL